MPTAYIYAGQWGHTHTITVKDENDAVVDLSTASTLQIVFKDPSGTDTTKTASLVTDGTDGMIRYEVTNGDVVDDEAGTWTRWGVVTFSDGLYYTTPEVYPVKTPGTE